MMKEAFLILLFCVVFFGTVLAGAFWFKKISCEEQSISFSQHRWGLFSGCMVRHNNRWLPLNNIRGFDDKG